VDPCDSGGANGGKLNIKNMIKSTFEIGLKCGKTLASDDIDHSEFEFDEYESVTTIFYRLSEIFYEREIVLLLKICDYECPNFAVELSILIEEFHNLVSFANNLEKEYRLHFYEQGADRLLTFKKNEKGAYTLILEDRSILNFKPLTTQGTIIDLNFQLFNLFSKILFLSSSICPSIAKEPIYLIWCAEIRSIFNVG
jgi:hypothetical protein